LAIDKLGRLWVGHLNTGISVFNGKDWKNYDVVDGPIGERIFDIKICPKDGDVWMATSAGISRYKIDSDDWEHLTREDGLLEDQASSLAFKNDGTLIVGTQCHGLAIFNRTIKGEYRHSKNIVAPDRFGQGNISPVPLTPRGIGLPSNLINDIIVTKNLEAETIWIATNAGLVKSNDTFTKLEYWRGKDYVDKVKGLYGGSPKDWKPASKEVMDQILPEDYLTCLAEDEQGVIWIGTRQNGFLIADSKTGKKAYGTQKGIGLPDNFVTKILILGNGDYLIGSYGGGIVKPINPYKLVDRQPAATKFNKDKIISVAQNNFPNLPSPIDPPTFEDIVLMRKKIAGLSTKIPKIYAAYCGEDWKTQGDWLGRKTTSWAIMCAAQAPFDHRLIYPGVYKLQEFIGPNATKDDTLRRWLHWVKTDNPRSLWDPFNGYRRQAEWDDHGEAYSMNKDGPDLWYWLEISDDGMFSPRMYFFNKDGHNGNNRFRDYVIEIYSANERFEGHPFDVWKKYSLLAERAVRLQKPLAKSRVNNFWGGVYKEFLLPKGMYYVKIRRNYSFNTIVSAVIVDRLQGKKTSIIESMIPYVTHFVSAKNPYQLCPLPFPKHIDSKTGRLIVDTWNNLDNVYNRKDGIRLQREMRINLYRKTNLLANEDENLSQINKVIKWRLNQWDTEQRKEWLESMKEAFKNFYDNNEWLQKAIKEGKI
jgi:hypothetical protein